MSEIGMNIMVVDENSNNVLFWEMTIKAKFSDAKITTCKTGYEALDIAKKEKFHFFVASWELKPMSGLIFMQRLRDERKHKHTPVLIVSQLLKEEDMYIAREFGIDNYLLRPFDKAKVLEKISSMVEDEKKLDSTQRTLRKVEDWIHENKVNEALKLINDTLKPGPHAAKAYSLNGEIWTRTNQYERAEKSFKQALSYEADYPAALGGLGRLYLKMKKYGEAIAQFELLNKKAPQNLDRLVNLGDAYLGKGDEQKAEELYKQVKTLDEENGDATAGLGKVEFNRGNMELAAQFFRESGKGSEVAAHFNNMGIALVSQDKNDEAIALYKNAINVLPDGTKTHLLEFNIGLAFKKAERAAEAAEAFARSLLSNPSYEKALAGLATCAKEAKAKGLKMNTELLDQAVQKRQEYLKEHPEAKLAV